MAKEKFHENDSRSSPRIIRKNAFLNEQLSISKYWLENSVAIQNIFYWNDTPMWPN